MLEQDRALLLQNIARRLAETADREQVIQELCESQKLIWGDAEALIEEALREYHPAITRRQSPILILAALSIFIGGAALAAWQLLGLVALLSSLAQPQFATFWDLYNLSFGFFHTLTNLPGLLFSFFTGMAMVLGSYYGMQEVWSAWLEAAEGDLQLFQGDFPTPGSLPPSPSPSEPERVYTASGWASHRVADPQLVELILDRLEKSENKAWVISSVALTQGLSWPVAHQMVESVAEAHGLVFNDEITYGPPVVLGALGVFLAGFVITFQYLVLAGVVLAPQFGQIENSWSFMLFMFALGDYIQMSPGAFLLYVLGLVMLVGGLFALRKVAPSVYRWQDRGAL